MDNHILCQKGLCEVKEVTSAKGNMMHLSFLLIPISSSVTHSHLLGAWGRQTQPAWSCNSGINFACEGTMVLGFQEQSHQEVLRNGNNFWGELL